MQKKAKVDPKLSWRAKPGAQLDAALRELRQVRPTRPPAPTTKVISSGLVRTTVYLSPCELDVLADIVALEGVSKSEALRVVLRCSLSVPVDGAGA